MLSQRSRPRPWATCLLDRLHGDKTPSGAIRCIRARPMSFGNAPQARGLTNRCYRTQGIVNAVERARNRIKSQVRSRVEHVFGVIKGVFPFTKVCYRGLETRLSVTRALANLDLVRRRL